MAQEKQSRNKKKEHEKMVEERLAENKLFELPEHYKPSFINNTKNGKIPELITNILIWFLCIVTVVFGIYMLIRKYFVAKTDYAEI